MEIVEKKMIHIKNKTSESGKHNTEKENEMTSTNTELEKLIISDTKNLNKLTSLIDILRSSTSSEGVINTTKSLSHVFAHLASKGLIDA